ncbi:MAG: DUF2254 domain-containing protein [Acidimicrobiia bacterium]|nr:DUF2254 domain-containing protein [Acidimicrobiia bacterium]
MNPKVLVERFRDSLFFVPSLYVFVAIGLAWLTNTLDSRVGPEGLQYLLQTSPSGARALLGAVAGATITVAGLVFSLTALTVQLSATQYSPRVLQGFLRDRFQQTSVGIVVGTFTYSLVALATAGPASEQTIYAPWAATVATVLAIITVLTIIAFIDHVSRRIRVDDTIRRLAVSTTKSLGGWLRTIESGAGRDVEPIDHESESVTISATRAGWVQHVDYAALLNNSAAGSLIRIDIRVGRFVTSGDAIVTIWSHEPVDESEVRAEVAIGDTRSIAQDPMFGIRQLVDIALRAMSPGINDPTTAADVIRHMVEPLQLLLVSELPARVLLGDDGTRLYRPDFTTVDDALRLAFTEIRLTASGMVSVGAALVDSIGSLMKAALDSEFPSRADSLMRQYQLLVEDIDQWQIPDDDLEWMWATADRYGLRERLAAVQAEETA